MRQPRLVKLSVPSLFVTQCFTRVIHGRDGVRNRLLTKRSKDRQRSTPYKLNPLTTRRIGSSNTAYKLEPLSIRRQSLFVLSAPFKLVLVRRI